MLRLSDNPLQRWPDGRSIIADIGRWWVIYTKPHHEKSLAWELNKMGIGYYLPLMLKRTRRRDNGKIRKSIVCMFPGYISVVDYPKHREALWNTGKVLRTLEVKPQESFCKELEQIYKLNNLDADITRNNDLVIGKKMFIASGPLAGIEGVIIDLTNKNRLFLNVFMFNSSLSISVEPDILLPIE